MDVDQSEQKNSITCPLCFNEFSFIDIEFHASQCGSSIEIFDDTDFVQENLKSFKTSGKFKCFICNVFRIDDHNEYLEHVKKCRERDELIKKGVPVELLDEDEDRVTVSNLENFPRRRIIPPTPGQKNKNLYKSSNDSSSSKCEINLNSLKTEKFKFEKSFDYVEDLTRIKQEGKKKSSLVQNIDSEDSEEDVILVNDKPSIKCPICFKSFPINIIEEHASNCTLVDMS